MHSSNNDDDGFEAPLRALLADLKPEARARVEGMLRRLGISGPDDSIIILIAILADFTHPTVMSAAMVEESTKKLEGTLNKHLQKLAQCEEVGWGQVEMLRDKILKSLIATTDDAVKSTKDLGNKIEVASKTITAATGDTKAELEKKYADLTKQVTEYRNAIQRWINSIAELNDKIHSTMHFLRPPWWRTLLIQTVAIIIALFVWSQIQPRLAACVSSALPDSLSLCSSFLLSPPERHSGMKIP